MLRAGLLVSVLLALPAPAQEAPSRKGGFEGLADRIRHERVDKGLPGVAIALVDGQDEVWAEGFGSAGPGTGRAMAPDTVLRVASVSKLFTATLVMLMVEEGRLDLDRPVREVLAEFAPDNPYDVPVTLRHLLSHRSGLVREPPVGHYFDPSEPSLEAMVRSLAETRLVHEPGTRTKYSNAGVGVAGRVVEVATGRPFAEVVQERVLDPLGMTRSAFVRRAAFDDRMGAGVMWTYDRRAIPTPGFTFGFKPASDLYSTVGDLGRFARSLFPSTPQEGRLLPVAALRRMWEVQGGGDRGVGIGFFVDRWRPGGGGEETLRVRHGGAVYGFATQFVVLPDEELAVIVGTNVDCANAVCNELADRGLERLLAPETGTGVAARERPGPVGRERARELEGRYPLGRGWVDLVERNGELSCRPTPGVAFRVRARGGELVADGRNRMGNVVEVDTGGDGPKLRWAGAWRSRASARTTPPPAPPEELVPLLGEYGWDHNRLIVYEDGSRLCALVEWFERVLLEPTDDPDRWSCGRGGMYGGEHLVFLRDGDGRPEEVRLSGVRFPRTAGWRADTSFRIRPRYDIDVLRRMAREARAPRPPEDARPADLVELKSLDDSLRYDIRYAGTNNFMATPFYEVARAMMQRPAAEALVRAHRAFAGDGYGILVYDAYRPWSVTKMFFDATPEAQRVYVADPSRGSRHNRGCAADITLFDRGTGEVVPMVSGYDEFTPKASPDYPGSTSCRRWFREWLRDAMENQGFTVYEHEWWHFDFRGWEQYPVLDEPL